MMESNDSQPLRRQADGQVRRLMEYYFRAYGLAATEENTRQFLGVYECFMRAVPPRDRDAKRLDRLVRAAFGIRDSDPGPQGGDEARVMADLAELTARIAEEQVLRQEEEALRRQIQEELLKVEGTVSTLYGDLLDQLERQQRALAEREAQFVCQERETQTRLQAVVALESRLQTALERRLHTEAHSLLDERVEALVAELAAIRSELADFTEEDPVSAGPDVPPLLSVMRRLKGEARAAGIDPLTGLRTRDRFEAELGEYLERFSKALGAGKPEAENVSLLKFRIDDFPGINDRYGRGVGDAVLRQVARTLKTLRRGSDAAYRVVDVEMAVVLPRTAVSGAWNVAELLRRQIADLTVATPGGASVSLTVSVGGCDALDAGAAIASCAAQALHQAGDEGGNRTVLFSDDTTLAGLAHVVPAEFAAAVRERLWRPEGFSVVAVRTTAPDRFAELQRRIADKFHDHVVRADDVIYLLVEIADAKIALQAVESDLEGMPSRAAATDVSEAPPATEASPGARAHALITQLVEMIG
jgi:diguanylate cyclase (GGDEF)-like protein